MILDDQSVMSRSRWTGPGANRRRTSAGAGFVLTLTMLGSFLAMAIWAQLLAGVAPAWLRAHRTVYATVWPQAWAFFANTADSETLSAYQLSSGRVAHGSAVALSMSGQNMWGLGRAAAAQLNQALYLASLVPARYWGFCAEPPSHSCLSAAKVYRAADDFRPAMLCGLIAFVRAQPTAEATGVPGGRSASVAVVRLDCTG